MQHDAICKTDIEAFLRRLITWCCTSGGVTCGAREGQHGVRPTYRPPHQDGAARLHPALRPLLHHRAGDLQEVEPRRAAEGGRPRVVYTHGAGSTDEEHVVIGQRRPSAFVRPMRASSLRSTRRRTPEVRATGRRLLGTCALVYVDRVHACVRAQVYVQSRTLTESTCIGGRRIDVRALVNWILSCRCRLYVDSKT